MTPVFCCGFECGVSPATATVHWNTGNTTFTESIYRNGARAMRLNPTATLSYAQGITLSGHTVGVARIFVRFSAFPDRDTRLIATNGRSGIVFNSSDQSLRTVTGGGVISASGAQVSTGRWYRIDIKVNVSANPHIIDAMVDGVAIAQGTYAVAATTITRWDIGTYVGGEEFSGDILFDDFVASATAADYPIGSGCVCAFVPTSDGAHNVAGAADFKRGAAGTDITNATTDSYLLVDEVPMDDTTPDTNDYINASAPPNATDYVENVFGPAPGVLVPKNAPRAVEVIVAHHQAGTGAGVSAFKLNDNGTEDAILALSGSGVTSIRYARKHYATMLGGGNWTLARFNNLRHRFGYSSDANPDQYFDCAMIEAEFPEAHIFPALQQPPNLSHFSVVPM